MMSKIIFLSVCAFLLINVHGLSLEKKGGKDSSDEEKQKKEILESLKEFVNVVDKYNLNVSVIGSERKYGSGGWVKEDVSVTMHMPVNEVHLTAATLDDDKQDKYVKKLKKHARKENIGVKARVIKIQNGEDQETGVQEVNEQYLISSPSYESLTNFQNGVQGFSFPDNVTSEILYNYVITDEDEPVRNIQVITAHVIVQELEVSKDFSPEVLAEIKKELPKLWLSNDEEILIARLLVQHLDKKFEGNHQAIIGVDDFALSAKKFAKLEVADSNILVFVL